MARYNDGTVYNSGARYAGESSNSKTMAMIKLNMSNTPLAVRLDKGENIITKSTANPDVPGNTAVLAAFSTVQTALAAANQTVLDTREAAKQATAAQDALDAEWQREAGGAGRLYAERHGWRCGEDPDDGLRGAQSADACPGLGHGDGCDRGAEWCAGSLEAHVECGARMRMAIWCKAARTLSPIQAGRCGSLDEDGYMRNGAVAGQKYWYRVAAFNAAAQGPWSEVAARPVM